MTYSLFFTGLFYFIEKKKFYSNGNVVVFRHIGIFFNWVTVIEQLTDLQYFLRIWVRLRSENKPLILV